MLSLNIAPFARLKGYASISKMLSDAGIPYSSVRSLHRGPKVVQLAHLEALCRFLRCTPNDLLTFSENATGPALPADHPLHGLKNEELQTFQKNMSTLTLAQLKAINEVFAKGSEALNG
ncbi:MAG: Cro/C1-type DNA-binding protein [Flaviaesturariibacter sp.]|nr:Cro/C1-type DNA-binding protein [Flaviaesturariibacter sp.]